MGVVGMNRSDVGETVSVLDQALYVHEQWCAALYGTLICRLPPDERDVSDVPYRRCPFGQWYYAQEGTPLSRHPGFLAIEAEHEKMHRLAAHLLMTSHAGERIPVREYEGFVGAMTRMRSEISDLRHELGEVLTDLDALTGAMSRVGMLSKLRRQQETVKRELQTCTLVMLDLDHFKSVNDEHGHQAGDAVLVEVVRYTTLHMRPYDEFFRYGGEEFLYCAPGTNLESGLPLVERLREGISNLRVDVGGGLELSLSASFGFTLLDPDVPVEESIARADQALYAAKSAGRNCVVTWDASLS